MKKKDKTQSEIIQSSPKPKKKTAKQYSKVNK